MEAFEPAWKHLVDVGSSIAGRLRAPDYLTDTDFAVLAIACYRYRAVNSHEPADWDTALAACEELDLDSPAA